MGEPVHVGNGLEGGEEMPVGGMVGGGCALLG